MLRFAASVAVSQLFTRFPARGPNEQRSLSSFDDVLIGLIFSFSAGSCVVNNAWEDSAKARGLMEYNAKSGILEWKKEYPRLDTKAEERS